MTVATTSDDALKLQAARALLSLIEHKQLYQSVRIVDAQAACVENPKHGRTADPLRPRPLIFADHLTALERIAGLNTDRLEVRLDTPKIYCRKCKGKEAFELLSVRDITSLSTMGLSGTVVTSNSGYVPRRDFQIFDFLYRCHVCKSDPVAFLVRREGWKLSLDGQSPIASVIVPNFIPHTEEEYYREALVASNCGKHLAACLYLRVFVEQYVRRVVAGKGNPDALLRRYRALLPKQHVRTMPSLREVYATLSVAIHEVKQPETAFLSALQSIDQHFKIRDVFGIV